MYNRVLVYCPKAGERFRGVRIDGKTPITFVMSERPSVRPQV